MIVRIVPPPTDGRPTSGVQTRVETEDGSTLDGVMSLTINIEPRSIITAEMTMACAIEEVWAHAFMSEASFLHAAERYGYDVKKRST